MENHPFIRRVNQLPLVSASPGILFILFILSYCRVIRNPWFLNSRFQADWIRIRLGVLGVEFPWHNDDSLLHPVFKRMEARRTEEVRGHAPKRTRTNAAAGW